MAEIDRSHKCSDRRQFVRDLVLSYEDDRVAPPNRELRFGTHWLGRLTGYHYITPAPIVGGYVMGLYASSGMSIPGNSP